MARHETAVPRWLKLDNAAKIYPPTRSRNWASMFRVSATLTEPIDRAILEKAQLAALARMPLFAYQVRRGVFWYYLERLEGAPDIQDDVNNPMVRILPKGNRRFLFRVRAHDCRIAVEVFHAITDGTGGLTFLMTLTAEYLRLKYGVSIPAGGLILDVRAGTKAEEMEDSFLKHARLQGNSRWDAAAYHVTGTRSPLHTLHITTGILPAHVVAECARSYGASVTEFLASVLIQVIQGIQALDPSARNRRKWVKVSVPVNLRPFYGSRTLRNFASYVNVGVCGALGNYTLEEIIHQVKHALKQEITEKGLNARFSANVNSERHPLVRAMPLFLKDPFMKMMFRLQGDRYCSSTLSNLGRVGMPDAMSNYVERLDFLLGVPSGNPVNAAVITTRDDLVINFSRVMEECVIERRFFTALVKLGIPVRIESNQR